MKRHPWRHGVGKLSQDEITAYFWTQVDKSNASGCWNWTGSVHTKGYGRFGANNKSIRAHVFSFQIHKGPTNGLCVCHTCDNRLCVNPNHLWLGTKGDNNRDMYAKGRNRDCKGEDHGKSKLTNADVKEVRRRYIFRHPKHGAKAISVELGVNESTISNIITGKNWTHVKCNENSPSTSI